MPSTASGRPAERTRAVASASRCTGERFVEARAQEALRFAECLTWAGCELGRDRGHLGRERVGEHDARDDASGARGLGIEGAVGQGQLLRGAQPGEPGEEP